MFCGFFFIAFYKEITELNALLYIHFANIVLLYSICFFP